jgi:hypothetical protein
MIRFRRNKKYNGSKKRKYITPSGLSGPAPELGGSEKRI